MNVVIVFNPIAGAGRAAAAGHAVEAALKRAGHATRVIETSIEPADRWLTPALRDAGATTKCSEDTPDGGAGASDPADLALIVVGGDGTVRLAAPAAIATGTPIYHYPLGTENLFAREFGFESSEPRLLAALADPRVRRADVGMANGEPFLLMVSVGFDAEVVHDLARRRTGAISHSTYAAPILRQFLRWTPPHFRVEVDGERIDNGLTGFVVVGNSREYGRHLNPARDAIVDDGLLDVVFFPTRSRAGLVAWAWRCIRGSQMAHRSTIARRGTSITITGPRPQPYQVDGDMPHPALSDGPVEDHRTTTPLEITIRPGALPVLLPPSPPEG